MNTNENYGDSEREYNAEYDAAIHFLREMVEGIEEGVGIKFIKGEDIEELHAKVDVARSLRVAINVLGGRM